VIVGGFNNVAFPYDLTSRPGFVAMPVVPHSPKTNCLIEQA
jgi:hypothetical protein